MTYFVAPERFETSTFVLRSYLPGDGPLLSDAVNTSYERLSQWMSWPVPNQTPEESEQRVRQNRAKYLTCKDFVLGVFSSDESQLLGGAGFHLREGPLETQSAEIGMFIRTSKAGRGLGTEVLKALIEWGFSDWPWYRIAWRCDANNQASSRVATKAGMTHEGTLRGQPADVGGGRRNTLCFSVLKPEWEQHVHLESGIAGPTVTVNERT